MKQPSPRHRETSECVAKRSPGCRARDDIFRDGAPCHGACRPTSTLPPASTPQGRRRGCPDTRVRAKARPAGRPASVTWLRAEGRSRVGRDAGPPEGDDCAHARPAACQTQGTGEPDLRLTRPLLPRISRSAASSAAMASRSTTTGDALMATCETDERGVAVPRIRVATGILVLTLFPRTSHGCRLRTGMSRLGFPYARAMPTTS
jgi:hypothetical protein